MSTTNNRQLTCEYFDQTSTYWDDIYRRKNLGSIIYQDRLRLILGMISSMDLQSGARILEIGCGAGHLAVELAARGFDVTAIDTAASMIRLTEDRARRAGVDLKTASGSVHQLEFPDGHFHLVVAVGVLPWLESIHQPLREMARVTARGGFVLATADRAWALHRWVDPRLNPIVVGAKRHARRLLESAGAVKPIARGRLHAGRQIDAAFAQAGLRKRAHATAGFGPFTFLNFSILPDRLGVRLHHWLQNLSEKGSPLARSAGAHYIVLGSKTEATTL